MDPVETWSFAPAATALQEAMVKFLAILQARCQDCHLKMMIIKYVYNMFSSIFSGN